MLISSEDLVPFCSALLSLSIAQQAVFIFCLQHCPHPSYYSGDTRLISTCLQMHVRTVQRALQVIKQDPILSRVVYPSSAKVAL